MLTPAPTGLWHLVPTSHSALLLSALLAVGVTGLVIAGFAAWSLVRRTNGLSSPLGNFEGWSEGPARAAAPGGVSIADLDPWIYPHDRGN